MMKCWQGPGLKAERKLGWAEAREAAAFLQIYSAKGCFPPAEVVGVLAKRV